MTGLSAEGLSLGYRGRRVVSGLTLSFPPGRFTAILGPNGCGKSTLLRGLARLIRPEAGRVTLDGEDLQSFAPRTLARRLGLLPQAPLAPEGIAVADLVARGRAPWRGLLSGWSPADEAARAEAMRATGVAEFAERPLSELSGGQRQRVWIALALAQETEHLLLDEPTTWLDLPHQIEILRLLARLRREAGRSLIAVLHDLNLAARHADHLVLLAPGRLVAQGTPEEVLTPEHVEDAFGMRARILRDPVAQTPMVVPEEL
ncbi:ABC transporter ATP-binding protein [Neomegalonema perideroedes]|uniref:ABC transporter ATP-binding protein n=1 Tax=Neomegalonema perideroedes TaxID=217219 RepID=UPI00035E2729|nr:ABC transporter ATP-binding protein [Neomegalonema perideroedes]